MADQLGCCELSVNDWVKLYQQQGLAGRTIKPRRGRKSILKKETDLAAVRQAVRNSRQRISLAKAEWEQGRRHCGGSGQPDNASVHVKAIKERAAVWQERGLFV